MNKKTTNSKSKKTNKKQVRRNSQKGKRNGVVGAPPKTIKFPKTPFSMQRAFDVNTNQCELSVRQKVNAAVESGALIELAPRKQAKGGVGRPMSMYIPKEFFVAGKMTARYPAKLATVTATTIAIPTNEVVTTPAVESPVADAVPAAPAPVAPTTETIETQPVVAEVAAPVVTEAPASVTNGQPVIG